MTGQVTYYSIGPSEADHLTEALPLPARNFRLAIIQRRATGSPTVITWRRVRVWSCDVWGRSRLIGNRVSFALP